MALPDLRCLPLLGLAIRPRSGHLGVGQVLVSWRPDPQASRRTRRTVAQTASLSGVRVVVSILRGYWSAAVLGLAAIVFLIFGTPSKAAVAGAGFALLGAALTRGVDIAKERRASAAQADADRRRDLDETRRVAYVALHASHSQAPELAATIVNALAHHGLEVDPEEAARHVLNLVSDMPIDRARSQRWLQEQIDRINAELRRG